MEPVLPVASVPYDESVETTGDISNLSAEEYLSWVRSQSARMPTVFRATEQQLQIMDNRSAVHALPDIEDIEDCSVDLLPSIDWERDMIHEFSKLRAHIASKSELDEYRERSTVVPAMKDKQAWLVFCLGEPIEPEVTPTPIEDIAFRKRQLAAKIGIDLDLEEGEEQEDPDVIVEDEGRIQPPDSDQDEDLDIDSCGGDDERYESWKGPQCVTPTVRLLCQLDQVLTQKLLHLLVEAFCDDANELLLSAQPSVRQRTLSMTQWVYSLLARVEKPLHRDAVADIRSLYRRACALRKQLGRTGLEQEHRDELLASLNMLISISGYYFGQGEYYSSFDPIESIIANIETLTAPAGLKRARNLLFEEDVGDDDDDDDDDDDCVSEEHEVESDVDQEEMESGEDNDSQQASKWRALE